MASLARRDVLERADRRPQLVVPASAGGLARLEAAHRALLEDAEPRVHRILKAAHKTAGNAFAGAGFVAMIIDYRGWGNSDGFVSMEDRVKTTDDTRFTEATTRVKITRTRLLPIEQVEDIRNAISYIQGEPGVDPDRIARVAVYIGAGLAGFGGMLIGIDTSIDPLTGFRVILSVFAAAVVGGIGSIPGAALGAMVVGVGEEMASVVLEPAYRTVTAFLAILLVLTIRPEGLLGRRG